MLLRRAFYCHIKNMSLRMGIWKCKHFIIELIGICMLLCHFWLSHINEYEVVVVVVLGFLENAFMHRKIIIFDLFSTFIRHFCSKTSFCIVTHNKELKQQKRNKFYYTRTHYSELDPRQKTNAIFVRLHIECLFFFFFFLSKEKNSLICSQHCILFFWMCWKQIIPEKRMEYICNNWNICLCFVFVLCTHTYTNDSLTVIASVLSA